MSRARPTGISPYLLRQLVREAQKEVEPPQEPTGHLPGHGPASRRPQACRAGPHQPGGPGHPEGCQAGGHSPVEG